MTTLNTIIEEEKKKFEKVVKGLGLREETIAGTDEQETVWNLLTSAIQRAYEAGKIDQKYIDEIRKV